MRDVTLCNYGNPKKLKNGLFNFSKLRILVQMFDELHQYQRSKYYHPSDDRTQAFCSKLWSLDDHDLYELSLKLEPREQSMSESED
ncbi:PREDICTED: ras-specific guanine nucleotide-releasing factor 1-like [Amphimedon queenslandica]|nr:PREDICTED: ras-specific guanine nucleotide-releasing factor 1-like [Amphimedon queenslandica]|eukprot:XP_019863851.1 PREDICTED: ras-specific guanine nucleotide-releasing factor 1-like [Amphimedon queenslandica]